MVLRLRGKRIQPVMPGAETDIPLLTRIADTLKAILGQVTYTHNTTTGDFDGMEHIERGGLHVLKGKFAMNSTRLVSIPPPLMTEGVEVTKISLLFQSTIARNISIQLQVAHRDTGNYIETIFSAAANISTSIVLTFGREFEYDVLNKISLSTSGSVSPGETVFFIVTMKEIIPSRTY